MKLIFRLLLLLLTPLFLSGCLYDSAPSVPSSQLNTWLLGHWIAQDKNGKIFEAIVAPKDNVHYEVTLWDQDKNRNHPWKFLGWISRVDNLKLLTLRSLSEDPRYQGKYLFFHYELMTPEAAPVNGVGARRIRLTALQLPKTAEHDTPYQLRKAIRSALKRHLLLFQEGSSVWTRTGEVYLSKE